VGRDVAPRKHGGAAALYDAPAARGRCLTYPRLAGTQAIFAGLPRNDDTRDVGPDVATPPGERRMAARSCDRNRSLVRAKLQTRFRAVVWSARNIFDAFDA